MIQGLNIFWYLGSPERNVIDPTGMRWAAGIDTQGIHQECDPTRTLI